MHTGGVCTCCLYPCVKRTADDGLHVLERYKWLIDSYVLDYFVDNHWKKLPPSWQEVLYSVEPDEFGEWLDPSLSPRYKQVWPLSLLALRAASRSLALARKPVEDAAEAFKYARCTTPAGIRRRVLETCRKHANRTSEHILYHFSDSCNGEHSCKESESCETGTTSVNASCVSEQDVQTRRTCHSSFSGAVTSESPAVDTNIDILKVMAHPKLSYVFDKHVKPKKRHEISKMAKIAVLTARSLDCQYIVDVGSGVGHLARLLAFGYGLRVCCLEAQDEFTSNAKQFDGQLEYTVRKFLPSDILDSIEAPAHLNIRISPDMNVEEFLKILKEAFGVEEADFKFGIVGLHPCGDLGAILLQLFETCPNAVFVNLVGCCYMKLTTEGDSFRGYPLSNHVQQKSQALDFEAREIACHAIETYCERLQNGHCSKLKIHCYRATLERILVKYWPHLRHSGLRSVKHADRMDFSEYTKMAVSKLGLQIPEEDLMSDETSKNLADWKRVVIFYSLRLMLAPLIETVLLFDRLLYLHEHGSLSCLVPVFDPRMSPRNHILIAGKWN